ncbi:MAG: hypothetical protein KH224_06005 [Veillonella parvula]|uniref:hypothetical protein n=1 Tax=Veillonella parvula TaxID=29466 RepID=UPI001D273C55|nr:hypothetical protein [Veillonella parvula]MBS6748109.1 hypothetical protein [Veillonella parvula]
MAKQQFKSQADICKKSLDILHKAIEMDPGNAEEYQAGIAYTEDVMRASNAIVKAFDVVEPSKLATSKDKTEDATKEEKPKRTRKTKTAKEPAPVDSQPATDETQSVVESSVEENADLFAMFGD